MQTNKKFIFLNLVDNLHSFFNFVCNKWVDLMWSSSSSSFATEHNHFQISAETGTLKRSHNCISVLLKCSILC